MEILLWVSYICTYRITTLIITTKRLTYQPKACYTFIARPISYEQLTQARGHYHCLYHCIADSFSSLAHSIRLETFGDIPTSVFLEYEFNRSAWPSSSPAPFASNRTTTATSTRRSTTDDDAAASERIYEMLLLLWTRYMAQRWNNNE